MTAQILKKYIYDVLIKEILNYANEYVLLDWVDKKKLICIIYRLIQMQYNY
jgi:hypothetical protein